MNRASATIIILPIVITAKLARALIALRVVRRPDVLPENVIRFPGLWYTRGRSDDPLRRGLPSK